MMIWNNLIKWIKDLFIRPGKREWLEKRVITLENKKKDNLSLPFKIVYIRESGFTVKVYGLYAFVGFNHMPWKYKDLESWIAILPKLTNNTFFCKIHEISKDSLSIIINGRIPQFKKIELEIGNEYKGLIIKKYNHGVLVDIGYNFDWKCGSFIGFLHKFQFESKQTFLHCSLGDEIQIIYQSMDENGRRTFSQDNEISNWQKKRPQELIGQVVLVRIVRKLNEEDKIVFLVNGKYKGKIVNSKADNTLVRRNVIREAKNKLKDGETIYCEVIGCNEKGRILDLKWITEFDTHFGLKNTIENGLDYHTLQKRLSIQNETES